MSEGTVLLFAVPSLTLRVLTLAFILFYELKKTATKVAVFFSSSEIYKYGLMVFCHCANV